MSDEARFRKEVKAEIERTEKARQENSDHEMKEGKAVAGFLRVLKIQYEDCEIQKRGPEPIDVWFREACFQVTESPDECRRRDAEIIARLQKLDHAETFEELQEAVEGSGESSSPTPCTPKDYFRWVFSRSEKKWEGYRQRDIHLGNIDLLVYINKRSKYLRPTEPWPNSEPLKSHGWRSVSFVDGVYARVLYAKKNAPDFLQAAMGKTHGDPKNDGIFPQELGPEEK